MKHSIILMTLSLVLSLSISGCSIFKSSSDEPETATVSEDGGATDEYAYDDFEDESKKPGDAVQAEGSDVAATEADPFAAEETLEVGAAESPVAVTGEEALNDEFASDDYPDDDYGAGAAGASAATDQAVADEFAQDSVFVDEGGGYADIPAEPMSNNEEQDLFARDDAPVVDTPTFADATDYTEASTDGPGFIPVKKMKSTAFRRGGANVNRLYVTRPGDNMGSISQKIYGADLTKDLYSFNPYHQGRTLQVGDKVYYSSPSSPNDKSMKTYYEDMGIPPQYYTTQEGDNIRKLSKKLLGHNRSWMEVYATNENIDSKDRLPAGLQIRYWPDGMDTQMAKAPKQKPAPQPVAEPAPAPEPEAMVEEVAEAEPPAEIEEMDPMEPDMPQEVAQVADPEPLEEVNIDELEEDFNPPPPAAGQVNNEPPGGKPLAPPPPPPPPAPVAKKSMEPKAPPKFGGETGDMLAAAQDDTMIMGAIGGLLILAFIIMLIFIRRSRAKRVNFSQTQV
ncbi:MAG: LysM peptidoglycan-binding domain-containing protein [Bdellovibrionales bacterium]|nr:LysM peptidoglycan-binding domain-containing protein [Bdellovibrionales bacterium]